MLTPSEILIITETYGITVSFLLRGPTSYFAAYIQATFQLLHPSKGNIPK